MTLSVGVSPFVFAAFRLARSSLMICTAFVSEIVPASNRGLRVSCSQYSASAAFSQRRSLSRRDNASFPSDALFPGPPRSFGVSSPTRFRANSHAELTAGVNSGFHLRRDKGQPGLGLGCLYTRSGRSAQPRVDGAIRARLWRQDAAQHAR